MFYNLAVEALFDPATSPAQDCLGVLTESPSVAEAVFKPPE